MKEALLSMSKMRIALPAIVSVEALMHD